MHAVIRRYTGANELTDAMDQRRDEVESVMRQAPGFVAYYAVRTDAGGLVTVTVCDDRQGAQESTRLAGAWVRENLPSTTLGAPEVSEGEVFVGFGG